MTACHACGRAICDCPDLSYAGLIPNKKAGAAITDGPAPSPSSAGSHSADVLADLAKVKALFQMRQIATVMGCPSIIRDVDGDGLMLTVEPLQFIPAGRTQEGAGVDTPSGSSANDFNRFHEAVQ